MIRNIIADNGFIVRFPLIIRNLNAVFKNCLWLIKKLLARLLVIISFKKAIWWGMFLLHASLLPSISPHKPQKSIVMKLCLDQVISYNNRVHSVFCFKNIIKKIEHLACFSHQEFRFYFFLFYIIMYALNDRIRNL